MQQAHRATLRRSIALISVLALTLSWLLADATQAPPAAASDNPALLANACPDPLPPNPFSDVSASDVHERAIRCTVAYEVTSGIRPGVYGPTLAVNRGQMATFLARMVRLTGDPLPTPAVRTFTDIDGVHADNIEALAAAGIVQGTGATTFSPERAVTRAQMATFLDRMLSHVEVVLPPGTAVFSDVASGVHAQAISRLATAGVVQGRTATTYDPSGLVTRAQMASFLMRANDLMAAEGITFPIYLEVEGPGDDDATDPDDNGDTTPGDDGTGDDDASTPPDGDLAQPPAGTASGECTARSMLIEASGSLPTGDDVDTFTLDLQERDRIVIRPLEFSFNARWRLVGDRDDVLISATNSTRIFTAPRTGTFNLDVFSRSGSSTYIIEAYDAGSPSCVVELPGMPWEVGQDAPIEGLGVIDYPGRYHHILVDLREGQRIVFRPLDFSFNARWQLIGDREDTIINATNNTRILEVPRDGRYRMELFARDTSTGTYAFELYDVTNPQLVTAVDELPYIVFPDNPVEGAGRLLKPGHVHIYEVPLQAGQRVTFQVDDFSFNTRWILDRPDGVNEFSSNNSTRIVEAEVTGVYRLTLFARDTSTGTYRFELYDVTEPSLALTVSSLPYVVFADSPVDGAGRISRPGQFHTYDIPLTAGQRVEFIAQDFSFNARWILDGPVGDNVFSATSGSRTVEVDRTGTYRLTLFARDTSTGTYAFEIAPA